MTTNPTSVPVRIPHINRVLVPIDFTEASTAAFWRAVEVAKIYRASLWLVHVMAHPTASGMANILPGALLKLQADLQFDLDEMRRLATDAGVPCATLLREGSILDQVREIAYSQRIDLLVLATHGGHGVHGLFLGSTAVRIIRAVTFPVLTVGIAKNQPSWEEKGARHILFAGDFCPETLCGLSSALGIQERTSAKLSVVRVVPPGCKPEVVRAIRDQIQALVPAGTDIHIPEGKIGKTVCNLARELSVGLVALGVHRNSFAREIFGSCLLEIILDAPCPVVSVRQCD
jgi:nucleotide-binding universal stress UspA family protein